ncbi:uncharacterized protein LOC130811433 [Amaranthus tricolor]|uniref:uncharacterized protein LOC130811433 n=1 Tax=Amaranthus tricolor TaxID=29722 RepID=UPI00258F814A|nr:uncharacterized protein LOC130811433 [Amaranthus tricolor]
MLERYLSNPELQHWRAVKRVLRYLQRTKKYMLTYRWSDKLEIIGYADSDFAKCIDTMKSTSSYIYMLAGGLSWGTDDNSLKEAFLNFGDVAEARVIMDRNTGKPRGFGFVSFTDSESANNALARLCTHGFLAVSMIVPQSLNPQGSKDTPYTFDEVTVNFKEGKQIQLSEIPQLVLNQMKSYAILLITWDSPPFTQPLGCHVGLGDTGLRSGDSARSTGRQKMLWSGICCLFPFPSELHSRNIRVNHTDERPPDRPQGGYNGGDGYRNERGYNGRGGSGYKN